MAAIKQTVTTEWKRTRITKQTSIAMDSHASEEERFHYRYRHTLEEETQRLSGEFIVELDIQEIVRRLAQQSAHNSSGKATALHGLIKARRITERVLSSETKTFPIPKGYSEVAKP